MSEINWNTASVAVMAVGVVLAAADTKVSKAVSSRTAGAVLAAAGESKAVSA